MPKDIINNSEKANQNIYYQIEQLSNSINRRQAVIDLFLRNESLNEYLVSELYELGDETELNKINMVISNNIPQILIVKQNEQKNEIKNISNHIDYN
jgi:hypothetical protein